MFRAGYEAGPTGYGLDWPLTAVGGRCAVVALSLVPTKAGDRVTTDRRAAERLARSHRRGDLTAVGVPDAAPAALRDVVRAREAAKQDQLRARQRLGKFLRRHGRRPPVSMTTWTARYVSWIKTRRFEQPAHTATLGDDLHEVEHVASRIHRLEEAIDEVIKTAPAAMRDVIAALHALRGVARLAAVTVVAERGQLSRVSAAPHLMGSSGLAPREYTSGPRSRRGGMPKTGNAHLRRIAVEAAWAYRHRPAVSGALKKRVGGVSPPVTAIAWKAPHRLHARDDRLLGRGKSPQQAGTAVARER